MSGVRSHGFRRSHPAAASPARCRSGSRLQEKPPGCAAIPCQACSQTCCVRHRLRSEEHTSELQSLMRISYAVFCLKKKKQHNTRRTIIKNTRGQQKSTVEYTTKT